MTDQPSNETPMCTVVITLNPQTGDLRIAGNILQDKQLSMALLIEAAHKLLNEDAKPLSAIKPEVQ